MKIKRNKWENGYVDVCGFRWVLIKGSQFLLIEAQRIEIFGVNIIDGEIGFPVSIHPFLWVKGDFIEN